MEQQYFSNPAQIVKENPIGPDETRKRVPFKLETKYSTAGVAQGSRKIMGHTHDDHDEYLYVLSGEADWTVGGVSHRVGTGDFIIVPAGVEHKANVLTNSIGLLSIYAPFYDKDNPDWHATE